MTSDYANFWHLNKTGSNQVGSSSLRYSSAQVQQYPHLPKGRTRLRSHQPMPDQPDSETHRRRNLLSHTLHNLLEATLDRRAGRPELLWKALLHQLEKILTCLRASSFIERTPNAIVGAARLTIKQIYPIKNTLSIYSSEARTRIQHSK